MFASGIVLKMAGELEKHPGYKPGLEHSMFFSALLGALRDAGDRFGWGIERREAWLSDRRHHFPELMLIGSFAYLEGELRKGWIANYGGALKRELYVLRLVRNALVHHVGDISKHRVFKEHEIDEDRGRPADVPDYVRLFVSDLSVGNIKGEDGKPVSEYITMSDDGLVRLTDIAFNRIRLLSLKVMREAGRFDEET